VSSAPSVNTSLDGVWQIGSGTAVTINSSTQTAKRFEVLLQAALLLSEISEGAKGDLYEKE
jgi:hypothetical protein